MSLKKIRKKTQTKIAIGIVIGIILSVWNVIQIRYNCVKPAIPGDEEIIDDIQRLSVVDFMEKYKRY